jgi:hypothetical protein
MSRDALSQATLALQKLVHTALGGVGQPNDFVHLGPPIPDQVGARSASLFAFHLEPNRDLRNSRRLAPLVPGGGGAEPGELETLPVDLRT